MRKGARTTGRWSTAVWLSVALVAITLAVFAPVRSFSFVSWDDPFYVSENPTVRQGITPGGFAWAFTNPGRFYWHPLTWLSHMADVEAFGMQPGAHHLTNLLLHCAGTLLLFLVFRQMTGRGGPSAFVAAIFGVHPLHVESVAWIAERKDVLSGVFWMLALWAYTRYVRSSTKWSYGAVLALFALALMSKPTVVTLPLVLLLLDFWPLGRMHAGVSVPHQPTSDTRGTGLVRLIVEKIPLFALALATAIVTFLTQFHVGAVQNFEVLPFEARLSNAIVSIVRYLGLTFWPMSLSAFYPFRPIDTWRTLTCLVMVAGISYVVVRLRRKRPYLLVGWLWYLVTLLPVIGLIQVGSQSMAARFTYLPLIGLSLALAWGAADVAASLRVRNSVVLACGAALVAACAGAARVEVSYWRDSITLWQRAVDVVPNNDLAHANLGVALAASGEQEMSLAHLSEALRILRTHDGAPPGYAGFLHHQRGLVLARQGRWKEAIDDFREVVRLTPDAETHHVLAQALAADGQLEEAIGESRESIRLEPNRAGLHADFASVLYRSGDLGGAIGELQQAIRLEPANQSAAKWHYNLAAMLNDRGRRADAIRELEAALAINPGYHEARQALDALKIERR